MTWTIARGLQIEPENMGCFRRVRVGNQKELDGWLKPTQSVHFAHNWPPGPQSGACAPEGMMEVAQTRSE